MINIRVHRRAKFAQSTFLCFQYLGFHDHTFNRAKSAIYLRSPGFRGQATEFSSPGLPMHCNEVGLRCHRLLKVSSTKTNHT